MRYLSLILILTLVSCVSCRTVKYVPVETVRIETEYKDRLLRDSIHVTDSVFIHENGDTVYRDRWRIEYRDRVLRDTVAINRTDTIAVPYPVERELSRWEEAKMDLGGWAIGLSLTGILGYAVLWLIRRRKG